MFERERDYKPTNEMAYLTDAQVETATKLLTGAADLKPFERWPLPFPMGVFGTLRQTRGNNYLMHRGNVSGYARAFLPHFVAHGLTISYQERSAAPFEIFFYEPDEWKKMIPNVDRLEGFSPPKEGDENDRWFGFGYYRTLAWLRVLPQDYKHTLFADATLSGSRNLNIEEKEWEKYPRVPCWVYSNRRSNQAVAEAQKSGSPVIWGE